VSSFWGKGGGVGAEGGGRERELKRARTPTSMVQQEPPYKHSTTIDAQSYCKSVAEYHSTQEMALIEYHSMNIMLQLLAAT
jgi:hypothetical protein